MANMITRFWNRLTSTDNARNRSLWFFPRTDAGVSVTHETALRVATVWACVRVIAESIGQLPWRCLVRTNRGTEILDTHPADRLLYSSPNEFLTPAVWKELVMHDVLTWGNSFHEIERDGSLRPVALNRISPDRVTIEVGGGSFRYVVRNRDKDDDYLYPDEVFHVRGLGDDLSGWSVIYHAAQAIGLGAAQDTSMSSLIKNDSRPAGLLTPVGTLSKDAGARILEEWNATMGGASNKGKTGLLSHAFNYTPLALPNTDAQLLESRKFSVLEICRFFRVPPHKVMDLERATFSNIEHQAIEFVQDTLIPWIVKLEQEANRKLISPVNRGRIFTKLNVNALLRGDFQSRAKGYQMLFDRGVYSVNDILELEDRNTIGPAGDIRLVPLNMQTLERAAEPPEPPAPPEPPEDDDEPDDEPPTESDAMAVYRPLLRDVIDRISARECRLLERDRSARWLDNGHQGYIVKQFAPHVAAVARFAGQTIDVSDWAENRCLRLRAEITGHLAAGGELSELFSLWADRIELEIDQLMGVQHASVSN